MGTEGFPKFQHDSTSMLKKYLTKDMYDSLCNLKTRNGFTLAQAIHSGVVNQDSSIGVYAGDAESYRLFSALFDPIIQEYHDFSNEDWHTGNLNPAELTCADPDPEGEFILSTRIRVGRNLDGIPLGPAISRLQRTQAEQRIAEALQALSGELSGTYYPLSGLGQADRLQLIEDHFLFKAGDRFLEAAGLNHDWPEGRGIFHNRDKTFLVWVNEEDQLRIISMQQGGNIHEVFSRLCLAVGELERSVPFLYDKQLGYLTSCPTNLGTAMRASVHIKLPNLSAQMDLFRQITEQYQLQIRGVHGEHSESEDGIFDISNRRRLGVTEVELVQGLYDGVVALIQQEKAAG